MTTTRRAFLKTLAGGGALLTGGAATAGGRWELLGQRVVQDRLDHDSIPVTAAKGDFESIKLEVRDHAVHFLDVKIHFANGETQDVEVRRVVPAGGETREIDVRGKERVIRSVEFWYEAETRRRRRRARVQLYGRH